MFRFLLRYAADVVNVLQEACYRAKSVSFLYLTKEHPSVFFSNDVCRTFRIWLTTDPQGDRRDGNQAFREPGAGEGGQDELPGSGLLGQHAVQARHASGGMNK